MSEITITIAVICVICFGVALIAFVQAREKSRMEKLKKINTLSNRHRDIQRVIAELPPQYLTNPMRIAFSEQSVLMLEELDRLKPSPRWESYVAEDKQRIEQLNKENPKFPPVAVDNEQKAIEIRQLLQALYRMVHSWRKQGSISPEIAQQLVAHVNYLAFRSKADIYENRAINAAGAGKPRVAIHNYHTAIETLKNVANHPEAIKLVERYRAKMQEHKKVAEANSVQAKARAKEAEGNKEEWDNFLSDEDEWKKKNAYDD